MNEQQLNSHLNDIIEQSKYMLSYKDNWDGENSIGYEIDTWKKAITFFKNFFFAFLKSKNMIGNLNIYHSDAGSIDLLYENIDMSILINIPKEGETISFFGKNNLNNKEAEGHLNIFQWKPLLNTFHNLLNNKN